MGLFTACLGQERFKPGGQDRFRQACVGPSIAGVRSGEDLQAMATPGFLKDDKKHKLYKIQNKRELEYIDITKKKKI